MAQRVYALALGYEDLNDHDELREDPLLAVLAEKADPLGESRVRERDRGKALAGKSTLNRLEVDEGGGQRRRAVQEDRDRRGGGGPSAGGGFSGGARHASGRDRSGPGCDRRSGARESGGAILPRATTVTIVICRCISSAETSCCVRGCGPRISMRRRGCLEELKRIVAQIRKAWPEVKITLRGDSGFCREELMTWCEAGAGGLRAGLGEERALEGGDRSGVGASGGGV